MTKYPEWSDRSIMIDLKNRFVTLYKNDDGSMFYIEPLFYQGLQFFKEFNPDKYEDILNEMDRIVRKNRLVVFTGDDENPITMIDDGIKYVVLTIHDITEGINLTNEPKRYDTDYKD